MRDAPDDVPLVDADDHTSLGSTVDRTPIDDTEESPLDDREDDSPLDDAADESPLDDTDGDSRLDEAESDGLEADGGEADSGTLDVQADDGADLPADAEDAAAVVEVADRERAEEPETDPYPDADRVVLHPEADDGVPDPDGDDAGREPEVDGGAEQSEVAADATVERDGAQHADEPVAEIAPANGAEDVPLHEADGAIEDPTAVPGVQQLAAADETADEPTHADADAFVEFDHPEPTEGSGAGEAEAPLAEPAEDVKVEESVVAASLAHSTSHLRTETGERTIDEAPLPADPDESVGVRGESWWRAPEEARSRLGMLAVGVAIVAAAAIIPSLLIAPAATMTVASSAGESDPLDRAQSWLTVNAERDQQLVVDDSLRAPLIDAGWSADDVVGYSAGEDLPGDWRAADYVVTAQAADTAVDESTVVVASFEDGSETAEIRVPVAGGTSAFAAAEAERALVRQRDGSELAQNANLALDDEARGTLSVGSVDDRIIIILGALSGAGTVGVDGFPVIDGEESSARRTVVLTTLSDQQLARAGQLTAAGISVVQGLLDSYMPAAASVDGDRLILRFPVSLGLE